MEGRKKKRQSTGESAFRKHRDEIMEERLKFCYIDSIMTGKRSVLSSIMRF